MRERRKYERFDLKFPATIEVQTSKGKETFDFVISNISSEGCFIHIYEPFPEGTEVRLKVIVTSESLTELTGAQGLIKVGGRVVRSNFIGMGICFDEEFQLLTLPNLVPE